MSNTDKRFSGLLAGGVLSLVLAIAGSLLLAAATFTPWAVVIVSLS